MPFTEAIPSGMVTIPAPTLLAVANRITEQLRELPESARRRGWERFAARWVTFLRKRGANEEEIDRTLSAIADAAYRIDAGPTVK